jgi:diguanylate cyclase (GGDEF)-like protein
VPNQKSRKKHTRDKKHSKTIILTSLGAFLFMSALIVACGNLSIPNPEVLLLSGLVVCASLFDFPVGIICAMQVILFAMYFYSEGHSFFSYAPVNLARVIMTGCSVIAITIFLGKLHQIWNTTRQKTINVVKRLRDSNEALQEESHIDPLTGLYNRNVLRMNYPEYKNHSLIVTLLDIDDFKKINDVCGHEIGDVALRQLSEVLADTFTNTDCYRYGGDEFLLIRLDENWSQFNLEMIHARSLLTQIELGPEKLPLHISVGYVSGSTETSDDLRAMFHMADEMLYESKRQGKNRVTGGMFRRDTAKSG